MVTLFPLVRMPCIVPVYWAGSYPHYLEPRTDLVYQQYTPGVYWYVRYVLVYRGNEKLMYTLV